MQYDVKNIYEQFYTGSNFVSAKIFGEGHIHETYLVRTVDPKCSFVLQKINNYVFRDMSVLMENIGRITEHLRKKLPETNNKWIPLTFYPCRDDRLYHTAADGSNWRLMNYIPHDAKARTSGNVYQIAGEAYAAFINLLSDLPDPPLKETIPDFHNLTLRLRDFEAAVENGFVERKTEAAGDILFAEEKAYEMAYIPRILKEGRIQLRSTHNDTKLNNILFDSRGRVAAIVDLDTVMPGIIHYDFGDAIRSFGNSCQEDESRLDKIALRLDVFESFSKGFVANLPEGISDFEKMTLPYAPPMFAYMQGIRFLGDYLLGDKYYQIAYPEHNLVRARNQFRLLVSMDEQFSTMKNIVENLVN